MKSYKELTFKKKCYILFIFLGAFSSLLFLVGESLKVREIELNCGIFSETFLSNDTVGIQSFKDMYCIRPKRKFNISLIN